MPILPTAQPHRPDYSKFTQEHRGKSAHRLCDRLPCTLFADTSIVRRIAMLLAWKNLSYMVVVFVINAVALVMVLVGGREADKGTGRAAMGEMGEREGCGGPMLGEPREGMDGRSGREAAYLISIATCCYRAA